MNANRGGTRAVLAACLIVAACSDEEPDPRVFARELQRQGAAREVPVAPVVASFVFEPAAATPPAPLAESRIDAPPRREVVALVGNGARAALGASLEHAFGGEAVTCVATPCPDRDAVELMMQGRADFAVIAGQLSPRDQHAGLRQTPLGVELWGLAVAKGSPLRSLSRTQLRKVLTGEVRSLGDLGLGSGSITVFGPDDAAAAQRAAKALIPGDALGDVVTAVAPAAMADHLRSEGAVGVVRIDDTMMAAIEAESRLLAIDWCSPSPDAFRYGTYPFGAAISLVTSGQPSGQAAGLLAYVRSPAGRQQLGATMLVAP